METEAVVKELHPLEIRVLLHFTQKEELQPRKVMERLDFNLGQCNQAFSWLSSKRLIREHERTTRIQYELTELGEELQRNRTPEERIVEVLENEGPLTLPALAGKLGLENRDVGSAFGQLAKEGILAMDGEKKAALRDPSKDQRLRRTRSLLDRLADEKSLPDETVGPADRDIILASSKKRGSSKGVFRIIERQEVSYRFTPEAEKARKLLKTQGITGGEIGALTPQVLQNREWESRGFRAYSVNTPPARVLLGRANPFTSFLEDLKDKLVSLGFEEFDGPLVETEFWNSDALFMPQFHAARDIHDVFYVKEPTHAREIEQPYLDNVAQVHENGWTTGSRGWGYRFDRDFTRRLILRSQGTVLSAKTLGKAKIPGKYFGTVRCFRPDDLDATHGADFYQTEGIVLGEEVNLKTLLGLLEIFAVEVAGAKEVRFVPDYFPFTEPSVEVQMKHPKIGWTELGGSGIFRPEVTKPMGVEVPVAAWGLGIDRMAMVSMGIDDIRELFTADVEQVRLLTRR
jgi:phenylalanyl-tRNA synthetase alpha chain